MNKNDSVVVTDEMKSELVQGIADDVASQFVTAKVTTDSITKNGKVYKKGDQLLMNVNSARGLEDLGDVKILKGKLK